MKLEEKISRDKTTYIHSMDFNCKKKQFTLNLMKNPRLLNRMDRKITFTNVSSFQLNEATNRCLDQVRGVTEYIKDHMTKYVFMTEQRTFMFWTDQEPLLSDLT
ncbi:MAG: hypothetical protein ACM3P0_07920 [Acidobacteriota bacterium]